MTERSTKTSQEKCGNTDVANKTDFEGRFDFVEMFLHLSKIEYCRGLLQLEGS